MNNHYDVIVVGGGMAGTTAAIAAARQGQKVLLLEKDNCLGGALCNMLVTPFMGYYTPVSDAMNAYLLVQGIFEEMTERYIEIKKEIEGQYTRYIDKPIIWVNNEYMKIVLSKMTREAGVKVLYHSVLLDVECKDEKISSVSVTNCGQVLTFTADVFIDCTGNAEVAYKAGFPTQFGDEVNGGTQAMTLMFTVNNVDVEKWSANRHVVKPLYDAARARGDIHNDQKNVGFMLSPHKNVMSINTTHIAKNPLDPYELSEAEDLARDQVYEMFRFFRNEVPGYEMSSLVQTGMHIGIRQTRQIIGEYVLTADDVKNCAKFDDGVVACNYEIDIHTPDGQGDCYAYFDDYTFYQVPYRSLVPKNSKNLLVAGRCISSTFEAQASYRVMPFVAALGHAAGIAASVAVKNKTTVKDAPIKEILDTLRADGAFLDKEIPQSYFEEKAKRK